MLTTRANRQTFPVMVPDKKRSGYCDLLWNETVGKMPCRFPNQLVLGIAAKRCSCCMLRTKHDTSLLRFSDDAAGTDSDTSHSTFSAEVRSITYYGSYHGSYHAKCSSRTRIMQPLWFVLYCTYVVWRGNA